MKKININSAFVICGLIVLACITLSIISYTEELPVTGFFAVMAIVFAMLLPACSLED
jgi:hypothetical protein